MDRIFLIQNVFGSFIFRFLSPIWIGQDIDAINRLFWFRVFSYRFDALILTDLFMNCDFF